MNEELHNSGKKEQPTSPEKYADTANEASKNIAKLHEKAAKAAAEKEETSVEKLQETAEHEAHSSSELQTAQAQHEDAPEEPTYVSGELKTLAGQQVLNKAQHHLKPAEKEFSKFIHNAAVDKISDVTGSTIARPSGLLVGGVFSLISSFAVLMICRYYGYEYNFLVALVFFAGGFAIGLFLEAGLRVIKKTTT